ncbi:hypothetical protein AKO1_014013 [Acrasis kona]|uniref:DUF2262 domain-containing protein n=1 Tax=Acrasis kona TaxID=1008807 RepID=A0AAW2Z3E7_9EUKA
MDEVETCSLGTFTYKKCYWVGEINNEGNKIQVTISDANKDLPRCENALKRVLNNLDQYISTSIQDAIDQETVGSWLGESEEYSEEELEEADTVGFFKKEFDVELYLRVDENEEEFILTLNNKRDALGGHGWAVTFENDNIIDSLLQ